MTRPGFVRWVVRRNAGRPMNEIIAEARKASEPKTSGVSRNSGGGPTSDDSRYTQGWTTGPPLSP